MTAFQHKETGKIVHAVEGSVRENVLQNSSEWKLASKKAITEQVVEQHEGTAGDAV